MKNAMLIGAILVFVIAVIVWATRKNSVDAEDTNYGSKFTNKIDGRCPAGTSEITYGGYKGRCYKGGSSSRGSSRRSSSRRSSSRRSSSSPSGSTNYGSKFVGKTNGRCPAGTVEITSGGRRGQCIKTEYSRKKAGGYLSGSSFRNKEGGRCPAGTVEITSGGRRGQCFIDDGGFRFWGWGPNQGKKCRNPDNTGCDDKYGYTKPRSVDFRYWGWGANQGKKCRNPDNTGCDNSYAYTRGRTASAPKPSPTPPKRSPTPLSNPSDFKYPGKGKTEGLMCKNQDGTVCDASSRYNKNPYQFWGWGIHAGMKCKNPNNTGCDTTFGYAKK